MPAEIPPETPDAPRETAPDAGESLGLWEAAAKSPVASRAPLSAQQSAARHDAGHPRDGRHRALETKHRRRRRRRWIWWGIAGVLLVVLVVGGVAGYRFWHEVNQVKASLEQAKNGMSALAAEMKSGDQQKLKSSAAQVATNVETAAQITEGPLWAIAADVPVVGKNVDAVQRVTRAAYILSTQALPPGLEVMSSLSTSKLALAGGGVDLAPFQKAQTAIPDVTAAFRAAEGQIAPIDQAALMPAVAGPIQQITSVIKTATPTLDAAQKYLPTLLDIAGAHGKKTYLLIFQNNAEIRATGGNPAASMIITVTDGHLSEPDQASSHTFYADGTAGQQFTSLSPAAAKLYSAEFARYSQNFTMTPDFPTTATLFQNLWKHSSGQKFDGVISIDPVVLSHLLAVAGPVKLATGEQVTSANAVKLLLSDAYERYPTGTESDAFFSDVSKRVFDHLTSTSWDPTKMLAALTTSAKEQRVYLNFTDPKAQALVVQNGLDGALPSGVSGKTQLGMYLNDSSVGKLEYHLTSAITATCDAKARTVTETMTLHNSIPDSIVSNYTLGQRNIRYGLPRTTMMLDVVSFAPPGATIVRTDPSKGRIAEWDRTGVEDKNTAVSRTVLVPQGKTVTVSSTVRLPAGALGPLDLRHTPTARDTTVTIGSGCAQLFGGS